MQHPAADGCLCLLLHCTLFLLSAHYNQQCVFVPLCGAFKQAAMKLKLPSGTMKGLLLILGMLCLAVQATADPEEATPCSWC
jgi:putative component of membrane protein insertase Oxa1/YidC/SpoIIIJ protein YidD